ncbi:MAG TPA: ATP-binding protein, partial [Acidobacteriaceae bacterium]
MPKPSLRTRVFQPSGARSNQGTGTATVPTAFTFRPRARLLLLLGDQLIRNPGVAVFELVKNAFDAESKSATVTMSLISEPTRGEIIIEDSGVGMDMATVCGVWLEPGTDFRLEQKRQLKSRSGHRRIPIGEKGV